MTDIVRHAVDTTGHALEDLAGEVRHRVDDLRGLVHPRRKRPALAGAAVRVAVAVLVAAIVWRWWARRSAATGSPSAQHDASAGGTNGSDAHGSHHDGPTARAATAPFADR